MLLVTKKAEEHRQRQMASGEGSHCMLVCTDMVGSESQTMLSGLEDMPAVWEASAPQDDHRLLLLGAVSPEAVRNSRAVLERAGYLSPMIRNLQIPLSV